MVRPQHISRILVVCLAAGILVCAVTASAATYNGTSGPDSIVGGSADDVIYGNGGDDFLDGQGGEDYIEGNGGWDIMYGGGGSDNMLGGSEPDQMHGEQGQFNILHGNGADDVLKAQNGYTTDTLDGDAGGDDKCYGDWSNFPYGPHDTVRDCEEVFWNQIP